MLRISDAKGHMKVKIFVMGLWTDAEIIFIGEKRTRVRYRNLMGVEKECWRLYSEVYIDGEARPREYAEEDVPVASGDKHTLAEVPA